MWIKNKVLLMIHLSLFSQTLVEESLIQTLALTEENRVWLESCPKGHSMVHRERHGFHNWSRNPASTSSLSLKESLNLTNPQSYSL